MHKIGLVATLRIAIGTMLAIALTATALLLWSTQRTAWLTERMNLAHEVYERHLSLAANAYRMFKQYGDGLIIGDQDRGAGEREASAAVRADIAAIRALIAEEIEFVGSEEAEELEALAAIEAQTADLIRTLERYRTGAAFDELGDLRDGWTALSAILDSDIDRDFRERIEAALAEEEEEVAEARALIDRQMTLNNVLALAAAMAALAAAALALVLVDRRIRQPANRVIAGVGRFGTGDYAHRIGLEGSDELSRIGSALDDMAARIEDRTRALTDRRADLERQVAERTSQLRAMLDRAQGAERNRRMMLSDVSHELKTPLTLIRGEADIALRSGRDDITALREALERSRDAASHTARIVDDLLFIARTEEETPRLSLSRTDLAALVRSTVETFAPEATEALPPGPAPAEVDPDRVRQALLILLDNARRHGSGGAAGIVVRLDPAPEGWRLAVEDDGPGMTETEKAHAFERFYRGAGAASRRSDAPGLGLGLPVARAIAQAHGGTITLADRPGGGLVAAMTLPAQRLRAVS